MERFAIFLSSAILLLGLSICIESVSAQSSIEATDVIYLYEKTERNDSVPVVTCIDLEKGGKLLAVGGDDHSVRLWDVEQKAFVRQLQEHHDWVRGLAFSPDRTRLATIAQDGQVKLWDVQSGSLIRNLKEAVRGMQCVVFHPNGTEFAICGFDAMVRIYDASNGNLQKTLTAPGTNNKAMVFSPDGSFLAVAGRTGTIRVWKTSDLNQSIDLEGETRRVNALAFSMDGSLLASGGDGPFIMLWNPVDGKLIERLPERPGKTYSLTFCSNTKLASGESDNAIRLWDLSTHSQTATLLGHTGTISTMVYEPASGRLISGSFDTSIRFWSIAAEPSQVPTFAAPISPFTF